MKPRQLTALIVTMLFASGCAHYWVPERALDAYAAVPRRERKHVVVAATRARDDKPTFIRASDAAPESLTDGSGPTARRRVRVLRPMAVTGIVLLSTGAALFAAGLGMSFAPPSHCSLDTCGMFGNLIPGLPLLSIGAFELSLGTILTAVGASTIELRQPRAPKYEVLQP